MKLSTRLAILYYRLHAKLRPNHDYHSGCAKADFDIEESEDKRVSFLHALILKVLYVQGFDDSERLALILMAKEALKKLKGEPR